MAVQRFPYHVIYLESDREIAAFGEVMGIDLAEDWAPNTRDRTSGSSSLIPPVSDVKTSDAPSGEKRGCPS